MIFRGFEFEIIERGLEIIVKTFIPLNEINRSEVNKSDIILKMFPAQEALKEKLKEKGISDGEKYFPDVKIMEWDNQYTLKDGTFVHEHHLIPIHKLDYL